ncbi:MAG: DUF5683 domain-containing protein [Flavisolibacter sp.]
MTKFFRYPFLVIFLFFGRQVHAQNDTLVRDMKPVDTVLKEAPKVTYPSAIDSVMAVHSPKKAAIRSAILPGWGQAYNKKYWKIPIVYGALGVTAGVFFYNLDNYKDFRLAYRAKYNASLPNPDSSEYGLIRPELLPLDIQSLRFYRDAFRRDIDMSVLVFILFWGLNVVDATVDAHLKSFDVSPDLSLKLKPVLSSGSGAGLSLVVNFK